MSGIIYGQREPARARASLSRSYPAPVAGWNSRDALTGMQPTEAVRLDNFFPGFGKVELRRGYAAHATGLGGTVKTIAEFIDGASRKMIAAANGAIFETTTAGAVGAALASGFDSDEWQVAQFDDSGGGAQMGLVNGEDAPQVYDGSTVAAMTISGMTVANVVGIAIYKSRSYFWEKDSQSVWYSATNALGGACTEFKLGRLSGWGGNLMAMATWSRDGGSGPQDYAVFITSGGDAIVYSGSYPGDADWSLVGLYRVGEPIGRRCTVKVGGELYVITKAGYIPMSQVAQAGEAGRYLSDRIRGDVLAAVDKGGALGGWQGVFYPRGNYMMVNVPDGSATFFQHVVNVTTGAWCRFRAQDFYTFATFNGRLYAGGLDGKVYLCDEGNDDDGDAIQGDAIAAWNYLDIPGTLKRIDMVRIVGATPAGSASYTLEVKTDFDESYAATAASIPAATASPWDTSSWDTTLWAAENQVFSSWGGSGGLGDAMAARLRVSASTSFDWYQTTYIYTPAGPL